MIGGLYNIGMKKGGEGVARNVCYVDDPSKIQD